MSGSSNAYDVSLDACGDMRDATMQDTSVALSLTNDDLLLHVGVDCIKHDSFLNENHDQNAYNMFQYLAGICRG